jgi:hypothetical protein
MWRLVGKYLSNLSSFKSDMPHIGTVVRRAVDELAYKPESVLVPLVSSSAPRMAVNPATAANRH